jgi:uncharacterized membrane protein
MRESDPSLTRARRWIGLAIVVAIVGAVITSVRLGSVASPWTNALGLLLGGLGGTSIGAYLEHRFGERFNATWLSWLQMAVIALLCVAVITFQALPAYCQLPVAFAQGVTLAAAAVFLQRLRMRLG